MRISDWSSDVCSSDLSEYSRASSVSMNSPLISVNTWLNPLLTLRTMSGSGTEGLGTSLCLRAPYTRMILERKPWPPAEGGSAMERLCGEIGRGTCRERVCQDG